MQAAQLKATSRNYANQFQKGTPEDAKTFDITITIQRENDFFRQGTCYSF